jgi:mRNA-degrading endonuclease RelE of RelBE toxin-antitoxin system
VSYQVKLTSTARKEVQSLPAHVRAQALQSFKALRDTPRLPRSKELRGKPGIFRIWLAGRWRIVYEIDEDAQLVIILRVRLKDEIDYGSISAAEE